MIQEARGSCPVQSMLCLGIPEGSLAASLQPLELCTHVGRNAQPLELRSRFMSTVVPVQQLLYPSPTPAPRQPPGQPLIMSVLPDWGGRHMVGEGVCWPGVCGWGVWDGGFAGVGFDQDPWTGGPLWRPSLPDIVSWRWACQMSSCSGLMPALVVQVECPPDWQQDCRAAGPGAGSAATGSTPD